MINKSKTLVLGLAALMTLGLVSCGGGSASDTGTSSAGGDTPSGDVPAFVTAEGKMVFYFKWDTANAGAGKTAVKLDDVPAYVSPYLTGSFNAWKTGADSIEMKRFEKTDYLYATIDWTYEPTKYDGTEDPLAFQIVLGYNNASGLPAAKQGLAWLDAYKSVQEAKIAYPANPVYTYAAGDLKVSLGEHDFLEVLPEAKQIENYTRVFQIANVPTYVDIYLGGSNNSWGDGEAADLAKKKLTRGTGADADKFTFNFGTQIVNVMIEYKLTAYAGEMPKGGFWTVEGSFAGKTNDSTQEDGTVKKGNPYITVLDATDKDETITDWSFAKFPADPNAVTYDVTINLKDPTDFDTYTYTDATDPTKNVAAGDIKWIYVNGDFNGWKAQKMTHANGVWSFTYSAIAANAYSFGFIMSKTEDTSTQLAWVSGTDKQNIPVTVTATATAFTYEGSIAAGVAIAA